MEYVFKITGDEADIVGTCLDFWIQVLESTKENKGLTPDNERFLWEARKLKKRLDLEVY